MAIVVYCFRFGDRYFVHIYLKERDFFFGKHTNWWWHQITIRI